MAKLMPRKTRTAAIIVVVLTCYASTEALAQGLEQGNITLDTAFLFRGLVTILLGIVGWYAKKLDDKIDALSDRVPQNLQRKLEFLDTEDKNTQSLLSMLRDQVNRDHTTKAETTEHRRVMEEGMRELRLELREATAASNARMEQLMEIILKARN